MQQVFSKIISITLLLTFFQLFPACHKSNDDNNMPGGGTAPASGKWKVAYFWDKKDETSHFANYAFDFASNGTLTVTMSNQTFTGTWSSGYDDSKNKFLINLSSNVSADFSELSEDWQIIEMNDNFMHFEHTSGGNGDTEILKFDKI
jgi:hypothetical protein